MNLSQAVTTVIRQSHFMSEALDADIVNVASLARLIKPKIIEHLGEEPSESAIMMAIRRMPLSKDVQLDKSLTKFMHSIGDITVRSSLVDFTFSASPTLLSCQTKLLSIAEQNPDVFLNICKGVKETTIVCDVSLVDDLVSLFSNEELVLKRPNLSAISVTLPPNNLDLHGVYYTIMKRLAWKGINLVEIVSTAHQISLITKDDDVEMVFTEILKLKRG